MRWMLDTDSCITFLKGTQPEAFPLHCRTDWQHLTPQVSTSDGGPLA
jgi:hypothetical protein